MVGGLRGWRFARLAVCAVGDLRLAICVVGGLQPSICAVGVLRGWRFARLAVGGWRFTVGVLRWGFVVRTFQLLL